MPYVEEAGNRIVIDAEYRFKQLVNQVPGTKYNRDEGNWSVPKSWASCVQLRGVFGEELEVGPKLAAWSVQERDTRVGPCLLLREAEDSFLGPDYIVHHEKLTPRQRAGVEFLIRAQRACLADGMGSGKTVQLICALESMEKLGMNPYPVLIVAPNSMVYKWVAEFNTWAAGRKAVAIKGTAAKRRKIFEQDFDVAVINWEGLRMHSRLAGYGYIRLSEKDKEEKELNHVGFRTVIGDEAHRAKNPQAQQTRAWWWLMWQAQYRFAATGTPVANTPEDAWSIMHGVEPLEYPSKTAFIERYGLQSWNAFGGMTVIGLRGETRDEFFKFFDARFIRRPTKIVIPDIPDKMPPNYRMIDLTTKQRKAYDMLRKEMLAEFRSGVLTATNPLTRLTRLLQLASAYGEVDAEGNFYMTEPSSKLDALDELYEELGNEQIAVFAESRQLIELAAKRLDKQKVPYGKIVGGIPAHERTLTEKKFQDGDLKVILLTMGAGGEGLTLTATRYPTFLQRSPSLIKDLQAVDRAWRKGQTRDVQPIVFQSMDTVESRIGELLGDKAARLEEVVRDQHMLSKLLT